MMTIGTLFSGGEGVSVGAEMAGIRHAWGIEYDDDIAGVARMNGYDVTTADVTQCDPRDFGEVSTLHASPPCPSFSVAKTGGTETDLDIELARAVCRFVSVLRPRVFTLENVYAYRNSVSWQLIAGALHENGYRFNYWHLCAADYGVPQTRRRMIVIARRDGVRPQPPQATHAPRDEIRPIFDERLPWIGWYEAIEDLIPGLPDSRFAPWQLARLPQELRTLLLAGGGNTNFTDAYPGKGCNYAEDPAHTVTTVADDGGAFPRAFILSNAATERTDGQRGGDDPALTVTGESGGVRAFVVSKNANETSGADIWRESEKPMTTIRTSTSARAYVGRVVQMTPRALARFQSFPDTYILPDKKALACRVIGNAVPPLLYKAIAESVM